MSENRKLTPIALFSYFTKSLAEVVKSDDCIFSWQKPKLAFCHRLAVNLQQYMPNLYTDIQPCFDNRNRIICDVLVHDRETQDYQPLAIFCKPDYLTQIEQKQMIKLASNESTLVLAVSFFPKKDYFLIYRALQDKIEYYHFDRISMTCDPLKNRDLPDSVMEKPVQYTLNLPKAKRRKVEKKSSDEI